MKAFWRFGIFFIPLEMQVDCLNSAKLIFLVLGSGWRRQLPKVFPREVVFLEYIEGDKTRVSANINTEFLSLLHNIFIKSFVSPVHVLFTKEIDNFLNL